MLAGITPALFGGADFLQPAQAFGNDSYTVSLLHMDGPDSAIGTTYFPDRAYGVAPPRSWSATAAPVLAIGGGSPFNQVGSFSGGMLSTPHTSNLIPTGDFTIDFWANFSSTSNASAIACKGNTASFVPWQFVVSAQNMLFYASSSGTAWDLINGAGMATSFAVNTWYHFAVTRQGSTWRTFINGSLIQTINAAGQMMQNTLPLYVGGAGGSGVYFNGYLDEFRISNGIARWTAAFTPLNQPYYARLNGGNDAATKLLLHFDGNYADVAKGALNTRTPTNNGASIAGSSTTVTQQALLISANGQRVTYPQSSELDFGRANFTIDFWYYRMAAASGDILSKRATNAEIAPWLFLDTGDNNISFLASVAGSAWDINHAFGITVPLNTWTHLAAVRNGSDLSLYVNGARGYQQNIGGGALWRNSNVVSVGGNSTVSCRAYIEEVRISDVARWTGPFTPPGAGGAPYS